MNMDSQWSKQITLTVGPSFFNINAVVLKMIICKDLRNWLNVYLNFSFLLCSSKIETLFQKLKDQKLQTMQL